MFIPSALVLHYSQSRKYNDTLIRMVMSEDPVFNVPIDAKTTVTFPTLTGTLRQSIEMASKKGDGGIVDEHMRVLSKLPDFRRQWYATAQAELAEHEILQTAKGNQYLAYKNYSLFQRVLKPEEAASLESDSDEDKSEFDSTESPSHKK